MAEKTEKPTDKRRKDSAKKGQTFKSKDITTTMILIVGVYFLSYAINFDSFFSLYHIALLHNADMNISDFMMEISFVFLKITLPFIAVCVLVGAGMTLLQTRFSIASKAIKMNFKALNPVAGVKKIFSMQTVKEFVKSICYLIVFICTCYSLVHNDLKQILNIYNGNIVQLISVWSALTVKAVLVFIAWALCVLVADFIAEYFIHFRDIKMDKHEVKQERKENDGNPEIKSARRRIHQEILSGEEMAAIRNSEVVLANPTHIAIAIYFNPEVAMLPFIALRSTNMKARAAITYAEKIGVPVIRHILLTRRIYHAYPQYCFISMNDDVLMDVMDILIWLRQVEAAGIERPADTVEENTNMLESVDPPSETKNP
ncbi:EscU/YscU/HrcU family type III secretion system export apparatus switch protein [Pectobacterium versatile]|uniref:EscU/YscU/HrcU family type III secretion system export apparatus switch protein n=1 Tax=Pectobacterium versatile TaxID=2488639 RepID=UPI001CD18916|nr:EscU/YscU/HrcU family type III secretion system export apparatus switch protein [Pectobacterium versatile]